MKIHSIHSHQKGQGHEECGKERQNTHDLIGAIAQARMIDIHQTRGEIPVIFDDINNLRDVLVTVSQLNTCGFADQTVFLMHQVAEDLALRPCSPSHFEKNPLVMKEVLEDIPAGMLHESFLDDLGLIADHLQNREVMIHHGVKQGIGEEVGSEFPDQGSLHMQAFADLLERITPLLLLESDDMVFAKKETELLDFHHSLIFRIIEGH